jgi:hypothetical protein
MKSKNLRFRSAVQKNRAALAVLVAAASCAMACSSSSNGGSSGRVEDQTDFTSAPPNGMGVSVGFSGSTGATGGGLATGAAAPNAATDNASKSSGNASSSAPRTVEETDLYRVDGDRLYYLNGYRGLMIFDISNIDRPKLIGRSAIFGSPVEMVVHNGIATVVVADWYGHMDDGSPFHGSIVRGIDASDPNNIKILGEARLGGWVRDTRVVGEVLYAVSEEYPWWNYGWGDGLVATGAVGVAAPQQEKVVVSSVSFANRTITAVDRKEAPGYGGIFNVTPNSIMFAHDVTDAATPANPYPQRTNQAALDYLDISDPGGKIVVKGEARFLGNLASWGTDNGRWNLDFADGKTAHLLAQSVTQNPNGGQLGYTLVTADFTDPSAPSVVSTLEIAGQGWTPATRFDKGRMYLAPSDYYGNGNQGTPIQIFDISNPQAPKVAGGTTVPGSVWNFTPSGDGTRLFALGNDAYDPLNQNDYGAQIALRYLDVADPTQPAVIGTTEFGKGWAWTPAAGTFKAFTKSDPDGLVVLPFSGWSDVDNKYNNGLQLIEFTPTGLGSNATAPTKGWVERGIFAHGAGANAPTRLLSLSDLSLAVVDYTVHNSPQIKYELPLARNVVDARPNTNGTIAQLSSDWWYENDQDHSSLRVFKIADAEENKSDLAVAEVNIEGNNSQVFHNGKYSYVVSTVRHEITCAGNVYQGGIAPSGRAGVAPKCYSYSQQIQVIDMSTTPPTLLGKKALPDITRYYWQYGGWYGCYYYDWYGGAEMVQVGGDKLAFRRWIPEYGPSNEYVDAYSSLFIVDLSDPNSPNVASTVIAHDSDTWWGNMRAIGDTLYTTHFEWFNRPTNGGQQNEYLVKYYLDRIDLSDPHAPRIGARINVPGLLVGGSETDPSIIYTIDYRWYSENHWNNSFDVLKIAGDNAYLQSEVQIPGWVGNTFVRGNKAYMSLQQYDQVGPNYQQSYVRLLQLDMTNPKNVSLTASKADKGWGWLLGVEGDRALVTSGWGGDGLDIYKLSASAPVFDQTVRTLGWGATSLARQGDQIFLASGHWGVQTIDLK